MKSMKNVLRILVTLWTGVMIPVVGVAAGEPSEPTVQSIVTIKGIDYPVFGFSELKPIKQVPPKYPIWEGEKGRPGNVVVLVLVDRSGQPAEVMVRQSEPSPAFGEAAAKAVKKWRFQSARWKGKPTEYLMQVPLVFRASR